MMRVRAVGLALILGSLAIPGSHARPPDDFDASDGAIGAPPGFVRVARPARPAAEAAALSALGAEGAARRHLKERAADYRLRDEEVLEAIVDSTHDTGRGAIIVTFRRQVDGVDVFRDEMRFAMDRGHELVAISGYLTGSAREPSGRGAFRKREEESIAAALADLTGEAHSPGGLRRERRLPGGYDAYAPIAGAASRLLAGQSVRIRKVYFRLADRLEAAHHLELEAAVPGEPDSLFYAYVISAEDGRVLLRKNLTADADFSYRVWADPSGDRAPLDGPYGSQATPHPTGLPDGTQVPFTAPVLVTLQNGPISTNDPWLAPTATQTTGNNADAFADLVSPDGFTTGDLRADLTGPLSFDRTYDTAQTPVASQTQQKAAVTQLFYDVNFLHDWFYDSGFDEASRNAQTNNYGRGGIGNDSMRAEAQDYGGRNNANMSTPSDGARPRMQMYIFNANGPSMLSVSLPPSLAGSYGTGSAAFGPSSFMTGGLVVLADDGGGAITDGCETPFANAGEVAGRLVLIDRGTCNFTVKVKNAQLNGALGAIIANNTSGTFTMGGTDATITIPSLMISQQDGALIRAELAAGVEAVLERQAAVDHDGTLDNQIVAHEWGHYISNRLIGNSVGLINAQGGGMGEGWGDFHALLMTARPEDALAPGNDQFDGVYALAAYAVAGTQGHYFGIRRYPYSTDPARNPLTFGHIANGVPLPAGAPVAGGAAGTGNAEVHNTGEIWATMLWECYTSLLRDTLGPLPRLTFAEAQLRMRDYLVASYKLTPSTPTVLEARDALLAVALAVDPVDHELFQRAFAKRGAGRGAVAPDRLSVANQFAVESFVSGDLVLDGLLVDDAASGCDADAVLDAGETVQLVLTLRNRGPLDLGATPATVASLSTGVSFPSGDDVVFPPAAPGGTTTATVDVSLGSVPGIRALDFTLSYDNPDLEIPGPHALDFSVRGNADDPAGLSSGDDVESAAPAWTTAADGALDTSLPFRRVAETATDHRWLGPASRLVSDQYLISPPLQVAATGSFSFSFRHRFLFEYTSGTPNTYYDGGVIEISTNDGATWSDIAASPYFVNPGYTGPLASGGGNPLSGRQAWSGDSPGFPDFSTVHVDLGASLQGQTVRIRFRVGTDTGTDNYGWEIDDIVFGNLTNLPFAVVVAEAGSCGDSDGDTILDPDDCAPLDSSLWSSPGPAIDLTLEAAAPTLFSWMEPADPGGSGGVLYDLLRSETASFATADCLESGDLDLAAEDAASPATIYFYLVRSRNGCGSNAGADSGGTPRAIAACP